MSTTHSVVLFCCLALALRIEFSEAQGPCEYAAIRCLSDFESISDGSNLTTFLRQGSKSACRVFEKSVDCLNKLQDYYKCDESSLDHILNAPVKKLVQMYDYLCEEKLNDIEDNWSCMADFPEQLEKALCGESIHACNYKSAIRCSDNVLHRNAQCFREAEQLGRSVLKKYMSTMVGCTEDKEVCHLPATQCRSSFPGSTKKNEHRSFLSLGISRICSQMKNNLKCFQEVADRSDCWFFPQVYFGDSYTAYVNFFSYICEDRVRDIAPHWNCLSEIGKDLVLCTSQIGKRCNKKSAEKCADDLLKKSVRCIDSKVKSLVYDLIHKKMKLFNDC